ncbi:uncharacterized protein LOC127739303 [Mytilus californianus]|uniref:uncharacterized protein LOC127739303 n=1 Tax=Mytilus californianus TaxID=6549 RepID=UPI0022460FE7|nr:uncharacterized protein LOC127739303 [Mytilus californianus]
MFQDLPALGYLDLSSNQITTIQEGTFQNLPALNTLNLANNPLDCCDCDLENLKLYLLNNTHLLGAFATCHGTATFVYDINFTDCADSTGSTMPQSTKITTGGETESTTDKLTTEIITSGLTTEGTPAEQTAENTTYMLTTEIITGELTTEGTTAVQTAESITFVSTKESITVTSTKEITTVVPTRESTTVASTKESTTVESKKENTTVASTKEINIVVSTKKSTPVASTKESTTDTIATLYNTNDPIIVGSVGAFIAIMSLVGAVFATCLILNRLNLKKETRKELPDSFDRRQFPAMPLRHGGHISWY